MNIHVSIALDSDDIFEKTPSEAALTVLTALGGDQKNDVCTVSVTSPIGAVGDAAAPILPVGDPSPKSK